MPRKDYLGLLLFLTGIVLTPFIIANEYYLSILVFAAFNCLACIGLCLLMGYAGQISIGHAAFIGIGAYVSGICTVKLGWSPWYALFAGMTAASVIAIIVGFPSLRLKGHYLAMATLGFGAIVHVITVAAVDLTGGPAGINDIPTLTLANIPIDTDKKFFYFSWLVVLLGLFGALNLIHSRFGRGLKAIHGSEDAASSAGVKTATYKLKIFVLSAIYASVAGSLYASYVNYIDPGPFDVMHSVLLVTMVAVGGMHNLWGAMTGAILLSLLPEFLSLASEFSQGFGVEYNPDYDTLIYGGILLAIMLFLPEGLMAGLAALAKRFKSLLYSSGSTTVKN
jgi:branched-chain amino acid transport system permease protein